MKNKKIIIGSRGSKLATIYAEKAKKQILKFNTDYTNQDIEIKKIKTSGDIYQNERLSTLGGKGLFSKKIEDELLNKNIDIAVHALKDMPTDETQGLVTNCFLERNDPREVLLSNDNIKLMDLTPNSLVGTSSYRREFQLKNLRNDLNYKLIRGNVDTRIKKLKDNLYDAIILSLAGINSLNLNKHVTEILSVNEVIPSAGQGVIALQSRSNDKKIHDLLKKVNHKSTNRCVQAERNVLKVLEGDCETAVGAYSLISKKKIEIKAELFSLDGKKRFYHESSDEISKSAELGIKVGEILKKQSKESYKK